MAEKLNTRKNNVPSATVLFLGSRTSSLFRDPYLWEQLQQYRPSSKATPVERFRECKTTLDSLDNVVKETIIKASFKEKEIEVVDSCIAELMKHRIFDTIITTNIGSELELAFLQSDLKRERDYQVFLPMMNNTIYDRASFRSAPKRGIFTMIKASGDRDRQFDVSGRAEYLEEHLELKQLIEQTQASHMVMVGFDDLWDNYIASSIFTRSKSSELWYINEEQTKKDSPLDLRLKNASAIHLESRYDVFFMTLCSYMLGSIPTYKITLDKLTRMEKKLEEIQKDHQSLQQEIKDLTVQLKKVLNGQKETRQSLKLLLTKVDTLLKQNIPYPLTDMPPSSDSIDSPTDTTPPSLKRRKNKTKDS